MALTIGGVKTPQAPGRSWLLHLQQLDEPREVQAADETPKLLYLPQFYFDPRSIGFPLGPGLVPVGKLSTGKAIALNFHSCYNEDRNRVKE